MSLYTSASGRSVNHASSSVLDLFKGCRRKFYLEKIQGWREKDKRGSLEFGKAIESAVQFFYENSCKPGDAVDHFKLQELGWPHAQPITGPFREGGIAP